MNRRDMLVRSGAAALTLGLYRFPLGWAAGRAEAKRVMVFTRSQGFEHSVVKKGRGGEEPLVHKVVTAMGKKHGFEVHCTKDGRELIPENFAKYDVFLFETTGDLTRDGGDGTPPMPKESKAAFIKAIADGKGYVGCHCASDTFHSPNYLSGKRWINDEAEKVDPYIAMVGGEFGGHGAQQKSKMRVVDPSFPATKDLADFDRNEEWYSLKNFAPDMHVLLVQETEGMKGLDYQRPSFPATWARMHGKGRVFYTSMGHREDVWESDLFQNILLGGMSWASGNVDADVSPNLEKAAPKATTLPVEPAAKNKKK